MRTLLILTLGQSDVQIICDGARHELNPQRSGALQDQIMQRGFRIVDTPAVKWHGRVEDLPDGDILLCTPKLDAVLRWPHFAALLKPGSDSDAQLSAIILDTQRSTASDPRHAGVVITERLKQAGVGAVSRIGFLQGNEKLENSQIPQDAVIRREVIDRVSRAIEEQFDAFRPEEVIVAATGGFSVVNDLVQELARLHATELSDVFVLEVADGGPKGSPDLAVPERHHPAAGVRARWQALRLIEAGNFIGAWGAVSHLEHDPTQSWTGMLKSLYEFAASLPPSRDCDLDAIRHPLLAVRAAIRAELALRSGDIPRAVHSTVAFLEAALWDGLNQRLTRSSDPKKPKLFRVIAGPEPTGHELLGEIRLDGESTDQYKLRCFKSDKEYGKRPFELKETKDGVRWYAIHDSAGGPVYKISKHFLNREKLAELDRVMEGPVRELRNDVAHNEPTATLMDTAEAIMREKQLWSPSRTFLSQPLIQDVLIELGVPDPANIVTNLLHEIQTRLRHLDPSP